MQSNEMRPESNYCRERFTSKSLKTVNFHLHHLNTLTLPSNISKLMIYILPSLPLFHLQNSLFPLFRALIYSNISMLLAQLLPSPTSPSRHSLQPTNCPHNQIIGTFCPLDGPNTSTSPMDPVIQRPYHSPCTMASQKKC